jgi:uncharacterized phage protein (TIGR01671 family)
MREIKFRAWDNEYQEWIDADNMVIAYGKIYSDGRMFEDGIDSSATLEQYTGMHDINGKKIYEGDIVEWDEKVWGCKNTEIVKWDFCQLYQRESEWPNYCEVIGNIHESGGE